MGDARAAFELFTCNDSLKIHDLAVKLCLYNTERQKYCDELYASAKRKLLKKGAFGNVIMLSDESWNTGFIGIVAARIAEEYNRPTLLFVHNGALLKGSARSIESVNIFTALKNCSAYIEEFGGHAQAAGVNVRADNFENLERALNQEIGENYTAEDFEQRVYISEQLDAPVPETFAREIMAMEPYGVGNRRPLFAVAVGECKARALKVGSPHLTVKNEYIDLTYFSGLKNLKILESDVRKHVVFEISLSHFKGRDYVKGLVRELIYDGRTGRYTAESIFSNALARTVSATVDVEKTCLSTAEIKALIAEKTAKCRYGLCLIASDRKVLKEYDELNGWDCDLFYPASKNLANTLLVSPAPDAELSGYRDIVFLDTPADMNILSLSGRKVFVNKDKCGYTMFQSVSVSRERLLEIFGALRRSVATLCASTAEELACTCDGLGFDRLEFIFAVNVFEELGLVEFTEGRLTVYRGVKADLTDSAIYKKVCVLQER